MTHGWDWSDRDGALIYPGAQMAAVLGLTDLFGVAERLAWAKQPDRDAPFLRVSH